jgi:hypothetical protein
MTNIIPVEIVENRIFLVRKQKVMLDMHLAELYGVTTKNLNKAVQRNLRRFPRDFMFQLTEQEGENLRFQIGTSSSEHGGRRYLPHAFTEQGVAMLSTVLRSDRAVQVNILIMRTFVKIRELMTTHIDLAQKIGELERKYGEHDRKIVELLKIFKDMLEPLPTPAKTESEKRPIGF